MTCFSVSTFVSFSGKPTTFATVSSAAIPGLDAADKRDRLVFALPGNPASTLVTFHLIVVCFETHISLPCLPSFLPVGLSLYRTLHHSECVISLILFVSKPRSGTSLGPIGWTAQQPY
jgi:hypothetical protein